MGCGRALDLSQPDENRPETLIGACTACRHNYLIAQLPGGADAVVALLPDVNDLLRARDY
jgi:hypothetical protein